MNNMTNTATQIANLMISNGKSAADMTHAVAALGGGSMQKGFARIGAYFAKEVAMASVTGLKTGRIQGAVIGGVASAVVIGAVLIANGRYVKKNHDDEHEKAGKEILQTMQDAEAPDSEKEGEDDNEPHGGEIPQIVQIQIRNKKI